MTKYELRERLHANNSVCEEMCLYDILECESEDEYEDVKALTVECLRIEISHIRDLIERLSDLTYEEVSNG